MKFIGSRPVIFLNFDLPMGSTSYQHVRNSVTVQIGNAYQRWNFLEAALKEKADKAEQAGNEKLSKRYSRMRNQLADRSNNPSEDDALAVLLQSLFVHYQKKVSVLLWNR